MATPTPSKAPPGAPAPRPAAAATPQAKAPAPAQKAPSRLAQIKRQRLAFPPRVLIYGPEGVGKSTIAADAGALFLDIEGGSSELEVARYPFNPGEPDEFKPRTYDQLTAAVDDLYAHPGQVPAVALDTMDALEALIHAHLCMTHKVNGIEKVGGGYGKGYRTAVEELRRFLSKLDGLRAQGMQIIALAHSQSKTFKNPEGEDYDRYQLRGHDLFVAQLREWCEVVGFLHFEGGAKKLDDDGAREKRARGWSTNRRMMELAREAAWDAKWRLTVPMPMQFEIDSVHPWSAFAEAFARARMVETPASARDAIVTELNRIGVDEFTTAAGNKTTRAQVLALCETSDESTLSRVLAGLVATPAPSKES
jgi:hypothetical protein